MFILADAKDQRAPPPRTDNHPGHIRVDDRYAVGSDHLPEGAPDRLDQRAPVARRGPVERLANEMGKDLGVCLGMELMPSLRELLAEGLVVFYDAVVDKVQAAGAIRVGMRVFTGHRAMRGPARVADPGRAREGVFFDFRSKVGNASDSLPHIDAALLEQSHTGRVVSPVFQPTETVNQDRQGFGGSYVSNNSTHKTNVTTPLL